MFGSEILEVAIGIIFVYLLVSVICSAIREGIEAFLKTRSAYLEHGIRELLHDADGRGLAESFFRHPLIYGLYLDDYRPRPPVGEKGIFPWTKSRRPSYGAKGGARAGDQRRQQRPRLHAHFAGLHPPERAEPAQ